LSHTATQRPSPNGGGTASSKKSVRRPGDLQDLPIAYVLTPTTVFTNSGDPSGTDMLKPLKPLKLTTGQTGWRKLTSIPYGMLTA